MNNHPDFAGVNQQQQQQRSGRPDQQQARHIKQEPDASRAAATSRANPSDATSFAPLVRTGAAYPHNYSNIHNPRPDHAYRQQPAFFNQLQQQHDLPFTVGLDPSSLPADWDPTSLMLSSHPSIPQYAFSDSADPHNQVIAQGTSALQHRGAPSPASGIPFPPPSHPSQHSSIQQPPTSFSPHVFSNHQLSVPASGPSSLSASPSPGPPRNPFPGGLQPHNRMPHPPSNKSSDNGDQPWNLVPYNLPFTGRNRGSPSGIPGPAGGSVAGPNGNSLFLRSPTPTKRQRTNQACEKCRDRKAKCNGARPTCQRCQSRGLPCEYAKERRMRGPNRTANGHSADGNVVPHIRTASSPARTSQPPHHPHQQVSVHISTGQGTSPPPYGSASPAGLSSARPSPPPGASHQNRKMLESWPPVQRPAGQSSMPIYRTVHVAHSHPDLHLAADLSNPPSLVPANPMQAPAVPYGRPRSNTTPYPIVTNAPAHPSPLYNTIRSTTEFSSGESSEPPSATSTHFGMDAHPVYNAGGEATRGPNMYGVEDMGINPHIGMLGLTNDSATETVHSTPHNTVVPHFASGPDTFSSFSDSPDSYKRLEFTEDGPSGPADIATGNWPVNFDMNVVANGLPGPRGFSTGTQSVSASSNPSTSSPGPISFRTHVSQSSGSSTQDTMGWHGAHTQFGPSATSALDGPFPAMNIDSPTFGFTTASPKADDSGVHTPFHDGLGIPGHYNYPWTSVDVNGAAAQPRGPGAEPRTSSMTNSPENDLSAWVVSSDSGDGGSMRKSSSGNGSSIPAVDSAVNGKVRSVTVLEVSD